MTRESVRSDAVIERMGQAMHRLIVAAERGDADELQAACDAAVTVQADAYDDKWERRRELLPAWFLERMALDSWQFGLMLTTGCVLYVESIADVTQAADGSLWLDVRLGSGPDESCAENAAKCGWPKMLTCPTSREMCSVALAHVVCVVELADT